MELFYFKNERQKEVDFVIKERLKIKSLIQVCWNIEDFKTKLILKIFSILILKTKELRLFDIKKVVLTGNIALKGTDLRLKGLLLLTKACHS